MMTGRVPIILLLRCWLSPSLHAGALHLTDQNSVEPASNDVKVCGRSSAESCMCKDVSVTVMDARKLQSEARSKMAFFNQHGFVLLSGTKGVYKEDSAKVLQEIFPHPILRVLHVEEDAFGREVGPGYADYGIGNRIDTALDAKGFANNIDSHNETAQPFKHYIDTYKPKSVYWLSMWGVQLMKKKLMHRPLALLDAMGNRIEDVNSFQAGDGTNQASITCKRGQKWYYYPQMTNDEIVVFTQFKYMDGDVWDKPYLRANFRGSFENPLQGPHPENRTSIERHLMIVQDVAQGDFLDPPADHSADPPAGSRSSVGGTGKAMYTPTWHEREKPAKAKEEGTDKTATKPQDKNAIKPSNEKTTKELKAKEERKDKTATKPQNKNAVKPSDEKATIESKEGEGKNEAKANQLKKEKELKEKYEKDKKEMMGR